MDARNVDWQRQGRPFRIVCQPVQFWKYPDEKRRDEDSCDGPA